MERKGESVMRRIAMLMALMGSTLFVFGSGGSGEKSFEQGVAAQEAGRFDEAIAAYSAAIESDPELAMAYFNRGLARLELKEFEGAFEDLSRTLALDAENSDALLARGVALHALKRDEVAVLDFTAALESDELDAEVYRQRAFSWQGLGESDAAIADLSMAIRLEPDRPELYSNRAGVRRQRGDDPGAIVDEALAEFTQAIAESDETSTRRVRGQAFFQVAEYELALADLNAVLAKEPTDEVALLTRGRTLFVLGDDGGALADYTVVVDAGGECVSEARAGRAVLYEEREDWAAAIRDYEQAIEASPEDDDLLARCAWLLATCPKPELRSGKRAVEYARRACEVTKWKDWFCLDAYAAASAEAGDFHSAVSWQERVLAMGPEGQLGPLQQRLDAYRNNRPYHTDGADSGLLR